MKKRNLIIIIIIIIIIKHLSIDKFIEHFH